MCNVKPFTIENTKGIFDILEQCQGIEQDNKWHPEGDVFNHSIQTVRWAFRETFDIDLILAALLHDVGKQKIRSGHENISCELLQPYISIKTLFLIKHHMRIWNYILGDMKKLSKCKFLANHPWFPELIQLARFDKNGRNPNVNIYYNKEDIINRLNMASENHFRIPEHLKDEIKKLTLDGIKEIENR